MNVYVYKDRRAATGDDELVASASQTVEIGGEEKIVVDKIYGPLVAFPIRVHVDAGAAEWVIERQFQHDEPGSDEWRTMARFPCQIAEDFEDVDK